MGSDLSRAFRQTVETRIATDYVAAGGVMKLAFPNVEVDKNDAAGYFEITWQVGNSLGSAFTARRELTPLIIFCQAFVKRGTGTNTVFTECDLMADSLRGQSWQVIANTASLVTPDRRAVDGANPVDSIVTATIRLDNPTVTPVGNDPNGIHYQVNVQTEGRLVVKYGETV